MFPVWWRMDNGKCKIKNDEDKTDYEDELWDDAKDTKKYAKICKGNFDWLKINFIFLKLLFLFYK